MPTSVPDPEHGLAGTTAYALSMLRAESAHHLEESLAELTSRERPDKEASGQKWREWWQCRRLSLARFRADK